MLKNIFILAVLIFLTLLIKKLFYFPFSINTIEGFSGEKDNQGSPEIPDVKRPLVNFYDNYGNRLNVIGISKPFSGDDHYNEYLKIKDSCVVIGVSSYLEFPNVVSNPFDNFTENYKKYKYKEICKGWIHGFKDPLNYFPSHIPTALISESDFMDCNVMKPDTSVEKVYDFVYICLKQDQKKDKCDDWATYNKNWDLAKRCLKVMCQKFKLKGLLIGRKDCEIDGMCHKLMDTTNMLNYSEMQECYRKAKFLFVPNKADASPRVLTEALLSDIPVLVNQNILGGWKYVNHETGAFFNDESDISKGITSIQNGLETDKFSPRNNFLKEYGVVNSGRRLKRFLYYNFGSQINIPSHKVDYVVIDNPKKDYNDCPIN